MKKIAVLTSGGDAPGMNAIIRAIVNKCNYEKVNIFGINYGFIGLISGKFYSLSSIDFKNKINRGGTFLYSSRFPNFIYKKFQLKAIMQLKKKKD